MSDDTAPVTRTKRFDVTGSVNQEVEVNKAGMRFTIRGQGNGILGHLTISQDGTWRDDAEPAARHGYRGW